MVQRVSRIALTVAASFFFAYWIADRETIAQGVGGGGGGGGGSSGVGNSGVQNSTPGFGNGSAGTMQCWLVDPNNDALPLCGQGIPSNTKDMDCCSNVGPGVGGAGNCQSTFGMGATGISSDQASTSLSGSNGGGCATCGSGLGTNGSAMRLDPRLRVDHLERYWVPNNRVNNSSFSPGYFSQFDNQIQLYPGTSGHVISYFNTETQMTYRLVDGLDGDTLDGVYKDLRNNHLDTLTLLNASGATVSSPSSAVTARINHYNGLKEHFQIIDLDPSPTATSLAGRFTKRVDLDGREVNVTYKTWTNTEIDASPSRQWQIDTVTDSFTNTLTFTYGTSQVSGRWVATRIDRNDGLYSTYTYASGALSAVANASGTIASMTYGQDSVAQTATVTIKDIGMTRGRQLVYHLSNDYMTLSQSGQEQVINQPIGVLRMIVNEAADAEWMMITPTSPSNPDRFIYLGGNLAIKHNIYAKDQNYDTWTYDPNYDPDSGGGTPIFYGVTGTLNSLVIGVSSSTTTDQLYKGIAPGATNHTANAFTYTYNSIGNVTRKTYSADSTNSDFSYDSAGRMTRARNRSGEVKQYVYDSTGHMTTMKVGLIEQSGSDVQTAEYGEVLYEYYPSTHTNKGMLKSETTPLYSSSNPTMYKTEYEYNSRGLLTKVTGPSDTPAGSRPVTTFTYGTTGLRASTTDPEGRTTSYEYDGFARLVKTTYPDSTTEQTLYGTAGTSQSGLVLKAKDRMNIVSTMTYDSSGAMTQKASPAAIDSNILDGQADTNQISDPNLKTVTDYVYLDNSTSLPTQVKVNGAKMDYVYDTFNRVNEIKQYPRSGVTLSSKKSYVNDLVFYDEDPYGRRKYYGYRTSDATLIRTITCTVPEQTFADLTAVWNQTRDLNANAKYIVHDAIRDSAGRLTQIIDGRGNETRMTYDSRGRETDKRVAFGTSIESRTQTLYDLDNHVVEVRSPRYFDSTDSNGSSKAREQWTYNGRGLVATHVEAPGTSEAATESFTYDLGGHQATRTDFGGNVWTRLEGSCCDKQVANADPQGHGSITNTDSNRRVTHTTQVSDVSTHSGNFANPIDAKTLNESTTRYDAAGRPIYQTTWLSARGQIDPSNPPIAGIDGIALANGLTTQYVYDSNLTDGQGLDSSGGVTVSKLGTGGTGTFNVSLSNALTKLADTQANGGAGISFSSTSAPGRASVVINSEDEISFSISDAAGRTVMSGKLNNYRGSGGTALNTLSSWSTVLHDATTNLSGYGTVLVTKNIDALGNASKSWTDAPGRTLRSLDQLDNVTVVTYDAGGNQLTVRDPNSVGADMLYDAQSRNTQRTDTFGDVTKTEYDRAGNAIKQIDAKNKNTFISYDARGRRKTTTDRISAATTFTYTALGQLASLTDAESQTTSYTYDSRGLKLTETYPDHTGGSTVGQTGYGIVTFVYDNAGRMLRKQDQLGDTVTHNYDLAGRMTSRNYRTAANSPSGTIADTDTFTFDRAGRMLTAVSGRYSNTVTYTFDPAGRKASEALTFSSVTYTIGQGYNARNELTTVTYPDSSTSTRSYHATGALNQLGLDGSTISTRTYDVGRRLTTEVLGNGITETRSYRNDNLLSGISYSNTNIGNLGYTWDANKNKTSETIAGVMSGYGFTSAGTTYDFEDRLTGFARASGTFNQSWSLTSVGDWTSVTTNGTAQNRTHGPTHELLTAGGSNVTTDVKGNITVIPTSLRPAGASTAMNLAWDFDNKMKSADIDANGSADVTFSYDALGRRVARGGTGGSAVYVQMDQQTIADYPVGGTASTPTYRYVYASYIDEPVVRKAAGTGGTLLYLHRNQQYSITAVTTSAGAVTERYAYTAYGLPTILDASASVLSSSAISNRYTYTGREWDATLALHHFRARWMSPIAGRFLGRDPIGYVDGYSRYLFLLALTFTDPTGNEKCCPKTFDVPEGEQKKCVITEDKTNPKEKQTFIRFNYDSHLTFDGEGKDCCCTCCSYKQEVRGGFKVRIVEAGGAELKPPIDVPIPGEKWIDEFEEDCIDKEGKKICYGHRGKDWERSKYKTKCEFESTDPAGINITEMAKRALADNKRLKRPVVIEFCIELDFKSSVIDTCDNGAERESKQAEIRCCQQISIR